MNSNRLFVIQLSILIIICLLPASKPVIAADFTTDYDVTYTVDEKGSALISQKITLTNHTYNRFVADYTLTASYQNIQNIKSWDKNGALETLIEEQEKSSTIKIMLGIRTSGLNTQTTWTLEYKINDFTTKNGRMWEINIPRTEHSTPVNSYKMTIKIPKSFGTVQYTIPPPTKTTDNGEYYELSFSNEQGAIAQEQGVSAAFGDYQLFNFILKYQLENPMAIEALTEIALLPNVLPIQTIYYQTLNVIPTKISKDEDGNYIATYLLKPNEKKAVIFEGQAEIRVDNKNYTDDSIEEFVALHAKYTRPAKYWEANSDEILKIVNQQTKSQDTYIEKAKKLYNYTVEELQYNNLRFETPVTRFGALEALNQKDNAVCMEYTDLLITLLRAAEIPARELDGYAYSPNDENQPLQEDILHSWVQFYDKDRGKWIFVDPTWESTSGRDYFTQLDTNRIIFVVKGIDSEKPYPAGSYKKGKTDQDQDVIVNLAEKRISGTIPFTLWRQNWEMENETVNILDTLFRWLVRVWTKLS